MSQNLRNFVQGIYAFDALVQRTAADQWQNATPCEGWNAADLVQHQCAVLNGVQAVAATGQMAKPTPPEDMSDPQAAWADTRDRLIETLDTDGTLGQQGPFWFNAPTVDDMIGIVLWDLVAHTWDLAQATDQPHHVADRLVQAAYDVVEPMSEMLVETKRTGAPIAVPADAPIMDRYLGLIGRDPS